MMKNLTMENIKQCQTVNDLLLSTAQEIHNIASKLRQTEFKGIETSYCANEEIQRVDEISDDFVTFYTEDYCMGQKYPGDYTLPTILFVTDESDIESVLRYLMRKER